MRSALDQLGDRPGVTSILLEGGPHLAGAFLDARRDRRGPPVPRAAAPRRPRGARPAGGRGRRADRRRAARAHARLRARRATTCWSPRACGSGERCSRGWSRTSARSRRVDATADGVRLTRHARRWPRELREGDSVAVNGVCLTAIGAARRRLRRRRDARDAAALVAGRARAGRARQPRAAAARRRRASAATSCRATSTASARSRAVREEGFARVVTIEADPALLRYVVEKGSIAVDGVSLTVARVDDDVVRRVADPRDARAHDPRRGRAGRRRSTWRSTSWPSTSRSCCRVQCPEPMTRIHDLVRHHRGGARGHRRRARWSSSSTTRTARTRATSSMAAQFVTPDAINFMATQARGLDLPGADAGALRRARARPHGGQERVGRSRRRSP